jgi:hypothetical protein
VIEDHLTEPRGHDRPTAEQPVGADLGLGGLDERVDLGIGQIVGLLEQD